MNGGCGAGDVDHRVCPNAAGKRHYLGFQIAAAAVKGVIRPHLPGDPQLFVHQVNSDHRPSAKSLAGADGGQADGPAAEYEHVFARRLRCLGAMDSGAHGFKHTGGFIGDAVRQQVRGAGGDLGVLRKSAVDTTAKQHQIFADMGEPVFAEPALPAGDVGLAGHAVPHLASGHSPAHRDDLTGCLVAGDHRGLDVDLGPVIPLHDVHIGAADGGAVHFNQDLVIPDLGEGQVGVIGEFSGGRGLLAHAAHSFIRYHNTSSRLLSVLHW